MDVEPNIGGFIDFTPKMDGENHGKNPLFFNGMIWGFSIIFGKAHIYSFFP